MRPEVTIIPRDRVDQSFSGIAQQILQDAFDQVPGYLWEVAMQDIICHGAIRAETKERIMLQIRDQIKSSS